jgi:methylase of polypeptide subunit release factors
MQLIKKLLAVCHLDEREAASELRWIIAHIINRRENRRLIRQVAQTTTSSKKLPPLIQILESDRLSTNLEQFAAAHLNSKEMIKLNRLVHQRSLNKPLSYVLGSQEFLTNTYITRPPILIPRLND